MMARAVASVVIPAHDEAEWIGATLATLKEGGDRLEVVVVCNGCSDGTAAIARAAGVTVVEVAEVSKIAALRCGDRVATTFPRIYLDGDVRLTGHAAMAIAAALDVPAPAVAGVLPRIDLSRSSRPVCWYYDFRQRLPVFRHGIIGAGLYAMNEPGRTRLGEWPDVLGDDQLVFRLFDADERTTVHGHRTVVEAPTNLRALVRRGVRVRRGNRDLAEAVGERALPAPPAGVAVAVREVLTAPSGWPGLLTWLAVNTVIRVRVGSRRSTGDWHDVGHRPGVPVRRGGRVA